MVEEEDEGGTQRVDGFLAWDPWASGSYYALVTGGGAFANFAPGGSGVATIGLGDATPNFVATNPLGKWGPSGTAGTTGGIVTWSIMAGGLVADFDNVGLTADMSVFGLDHVNIIKAAFAAWSAVANIKFVQVQDNGGSGSTQYVSDIRISADTNRKSVV